MTRVQPPSKGFVQVSAAHIRGLSERLSMTSRGVGGGGEGSHRPGVEVPAAVVIDGSSGLRGPLAERR